MPHAGWTGPRYPNHTNPHGGVDDRLDCRDTGCLFNIKEDPEERYDLASAMPHMLKKMKAKLVEFNKTHFNPNRGEKWPSACEAVMRYGGFWGPFLP